jgi:hypothetical protein
LDLNQVRLPISPLPQLRFGKHEAPKPFDYDPQRSPGSRQRNVTAAPCN